MLFGHHIAPERPTLGCSYVARIDFDFGPRPYKAGEDFEWRDHESLNETKAYELWVSGHLLVKPAALKAAPPAQPQGRAARR